MYIMHDAAANADLCWESIKALMALGSSFKEACQNVVYMDTDHVEHRGPLNKGEIDWMRQAAKRDGIKV